MIRESDDYRSWDLPKDSKRLPRKSEEREPIQRQPRVSKTFSSESEEEHFPQQRRIEKRHVEPRISDEEDWESELRIRRKQFMEKLATRDPASEEENLISLRRSSAEGKLALLKDPTGDDNMDSWTVSVGSRVAQLGSSQERSEPEDDYIRRRREYREQAPPPREDTQSEEEAIWDSTRKSYTSSSQVTSIEEDDDIDTYNFVLTKDSKRKSVQDLSRLPQEDFDFVEFELTVGKKEGEGLLRSSSGLYKRESIIKSQASEEDPEYLLPERPKLVQQEREHPFKKAWQMQKSRSEEDSAAYIIKESKEQSKTEMKSKDDETKETKEIRKEFSGEQYEDTGMFADDESESVMLVHSSSDIDDNTRMSSRSEETESVSTERSKSSKKNSVKSSDVEEDSLRSNWPSEEEQVYRSGPRSKSEETEWSWEREET